MISSCPERLFTLVPSRSGGAKKMQTERPFTLFTFHQSEYERRKNKKHEKKNGFFRLRRNNRNGPCNKSRERFEGTEAHIERRGEKKVVFGCGGESGARRCVDLHKVIQHACGMSEKKFLSLSLPLSPPIVLSPPPSACRPSGDGQADWARIVLSTNPEVVTRSSVKV